MKGLSRNWLVTQERAELIGFNEELIAEVNGFRPWGVLRFFEFTVFIAAFPFGRTGR